MEEGYVIQPFRTLLNLSFHFSDSCDFKSYGKHEFIRMLNNIICLGDNFEILYKVKIIE